jgi:hypothetical protein
MIDHPGFEARDAQALIDFIASQPEAALEAPGDPVVGMDGPSYGCGIQFITAARDQRVDAIAPTIAWNQLPLQPVQKRLREARLGPGAGGAWDPHFPLARCFQPGRHPDRAPGPGVL